MEPGLPTDPMQFIEASIEEAELRDNIDEQIYLEEAETRGWEDLWQLKEAYLEDYRDTKPGNRDDFREWVARKGLTKRLRGALGRAHERFTTPRKGQQPSLGVDDPGRAGMRDLDRSPDDDAPILPRQPAFDRRQTIVGTRA